MSTPGEKKIWTCLWGATLTLIGGVATTYAGGYLMLALLCGEPVANHPGEVFLWLTSALLGCLGARALERKQDQAALCFALLCVAHAAALVMALGIYRQAVAIR